MSEEKDFAELVNQISEGKRTTFDIAKEVMEDGENQLKIIVEQQEQQPLPKIRAESKAVNHVFFDENTFKDYIEKYATENCIILADLEMKTFTAVLDENATTGRQMVAFKPQIHPRLEQWEEEILNASIDVKDFVEFLMIHKRDIIEPNPQSLICILSQIRASQTIQRYAGVKNGSINGMTVKTTIEGQENSEYTELPNSIKIKMPVYINRPEVIISVDLITRTNGDSIQVRATSADLDLIRISEFEDVIESINTTIGKGVVGYGAVHYTDWDYLTRKTEMPY